MARGDQRAVRCARVRWTRTRQNRRRDVSAWTAAERHTPFVRRCRRALLREQRTARERRAARQGRAGARRRRCHERCGWLVTRSWSTHGPYRRASGENTAFAGDGESISDAAEWSSGVLMSDF